jgi:c-di-GMP-binding flagellar brake protein YcgR
MSGEEQRVHARIHVSTSIEVARPGSADRKPATLKDLSKGGARFVVAGGIGRAGEQIELYLPSLAGPDIAVGAEIIRATPGADGDTIACRFDEVAPDMRQPLLDLIEVLLSTSSGIHQRHARVARRMDIGFSDLAELRNVLEEISAGGLMMDVGAPLVLYEELDITVPDTNGDQLLILHARVVSQKVVASGADSVYRVGLEVAALRPETRRCLESLLETVLEQLPAESRQRA